MLDDAVRRPRGLALGAGDQRLRPPARADARVPVRSMGFVVCLLSGVLLLFPWVTHTKILLLCFVAGAVWLARNGGICENGKRACALVPRLRRGPATVVYGRCDCSL
jgi:hypothetical protein